MILRLRTSITYVPARNTIFLSIALGWAEVLEARDIVIGVNALDYSGYPDCRPEFIHAFESLAALATRAGVEGARFRVQTPLIALTKSAIIRRGLELGLDYGLTHSCYDPAAGGSPCGRCDSCVLRAKGFAEAGVADPVLRVGPAKNKVTSWPPMHPAGLRCSSLTYSRYARFCALPGGRLDAHNAHLILPRPSIARNPFDDRPALLHRSL